jgi:hypothetical protein
VRSIDDQMMAECDRAEARPSGQNSMTAEDGTARPVLSTYRLQLRGDCFRFGDAEKLLDYLDELGISHLYLSPILTAVSGSPHGYDVTHEAIEPAHEHNSLAPAVGSVHWPPDSSLRRRLDGVGEIGRKPISRIMFYCNGLPCRSLLSAT